MRSIQGGHFWRAAIFDYLEAQYVQVFQLKPAPFCTLFAGLGSTNKSAISLLFSYYLTLVLSSPPCPLLHLSSYLKLCGRSGRNCFLSPPVLSGYNGSPDTRFSRGTTRLMSLPDGVRYLRPPQSLVVSLLLYLVFTFVFSRTGGVLCLPNILTRRFPRFPLRNLCSLVMLDVSSLVFAAMDTAFFQALTSLGLAELRTLLAAPVDIRPRTSHSALSSYGLFAPLTLWRLSVSVRPLVQTLGSCPASGAPWSSAMPPSVGKGRVTNNNRAVDDHGCTTCLFDAGDKMYIKPSGIHGTSSWSPGVVVRFNSDVTMKSTGCADTYAISGKNGHTIAMKEKIKALNQHLCHCQILIS